jgi:hypothetical protein
LGRSNQHGGERAVLLSGNGKLGHLLSNSKLQKAQMASTEAGRTCTLLKKEAEVPLLVLAWESVAPR